MDTTVATPLFDLLHRLPADGLRREIALQHLAVTHAATRADEALQAAATRLRGASGVAADAFAAASASAYEPGFPGPARDWLRDVVSSQPFLSLVPGWITELRGIAAARPGTGACTLASAFQLWLWTMNHFRDAHPELAGPLGELTDVFRPLLAGRALAMEAAQTALSDGQNAELLADLSHVHAAHVSAAAAASCAELVFGYRRHQTWDEEGCATCYQAEHLDELEGLMPGIASSARAHADVVEADGTHPAKAGPCAKFDGLDTFMRLRAKLDGCLTGARLARERAAAALGGTTAA
jgi:hypothetical protein